MKNLREFTGKDWFKGIMPIVHLLAVAAVFFTVLIFSAVPELENGFQLPTGYIALMAGMLLESVRIMRSLKSIYKNFVFAYLPSLIFFLPRKELDYVDGDHLKLWQFMFPALYGMLIAFSYKKKVIMKLTEGITLMLTLSFIYWFVDYGFYNVDHILMKIPMYISLLISLFSIASALRYAKLSKYQRLTLSIWSSLILLVFAVDNIIGVLKYQDIEFTTSWQASLSVNAQYFLLGISVIYIVQNYLLLERLVPNKGENYKEQFAEVKEDHLSRYCNQPVLVRDSIFCILYAALFFTANHFFNFLPRYSAVWLFLVSCPQVIKVLRMVRR